jgi:hypothetical protein
MVKVRVETYTYKRSLSTHMGLYIILKKISKIDKVTRKGGSNSYMKRGTG